MSVSITLHPDVQRFAPGTTVKAYKKSNWPTPGAASGTPEGTQDASATVGSDGSVTFTGLTAETNYYLYAASPDRYASFSTKTESVGATSYSGAQDFSGATVTLPSGIVIPASSVDTAALAAGAVTAAKVADALKPSGSAAAGTEALRALGTSSSTAAAGNDSRLSDARMPTAEVLALPKLLVARAALVAGATTSGSRYFPSPDGTVAIAGTSTSARAGFYFDPADFTITGKTLQLVLKVTAVTNDTAPGITFTMNLVPATPTGTSGNNSITAGSVVSGSPVAIVSPVADAATAASATFTPPAAGFYILQIVTTQTVATGGDTVLRANLYYKHV